MKNSLTSVAGVIAAVLASLCCIAPVALALVGVGGIAAFSIFEEYRPHLIGLTIVLLGVAFFFAYRKREVQCEDGTCKVERAGVWNRIGVWSATLIAAGAIAFPYFGFAVSPAETEFVSNTPLNLEEDVSFLNVPLVCNAAPQIGCGSRAKFIMLDLMKDPAVKEAWLNRKGIVMAVVWNEATNASSRQAVLASVFSRHKLPIEQVRERDRNVLAENFREKEKWYKGSDVDALSIEEAGVIADRILSGISPHVSFKRNEDKQAFREDVKAIVQRCFLSLKSFNDLDGSTYHRVEHEIIAAGEKYLGKGNMPTVRMTQDECELDENGAGCCSDEKEEG